jgi:hypothetical protein
VTRKVTLVAPRGQSGMVCKAEARAGEKKCLRRPLCEAKTRQWAIAGEIPDNRRRHKMLRFLDKCVKVTATYLLVIAFGAVAFQMYAMPTMKREMAHFAGSIQAITGNASHRVCVKPSSQPPLVPGLASTVQRETTKVLTAILGCL